MTRLMVRFRLMSRALATRAMLSAFLLGGPGWLSGVSAWDRLDYIPGGKSGTPFQISCGENAVLVGIKGRAGQTIDQVQGLCVKVDPVSGSWIGGVYQTSAFGGGGGSPFVMQCDVGTGVVGITGYTTYSPVYIAQLGIDCAYVVPSRFSAQYLATEGKINEDTPSVGTRPPESKIEFSRTCYSPEAHVSRVLREDKRGYDSYLTGGTIATGLIGRSGSLIDAIDVTCGFIDRPLKDYQISLGIQPSHSILHGTPVTVQWRVSGVSPELTPPMNFSWQLEQYPERYGLGFTARTFPHPSGGSFTVWGPINLIPLAGSPCPEPNRTGCPGNSSHADLGEVRPGRFRLTVTTHIRDSPFQQNEFNFEVKENRPVSVVVRPNPAGGGMAVTGTVALEGPAPRSGKVIHLYSSSPELVGVPPKVVIPAGASATTFAASVSPQIREPLSVVIRALDRNPFSETATQQSVGSAVTSRGVDTEGQSGPSESSVETQPNAGEQKGGSSEAVTERGVGIFDPGRARMRPAAPMIPAPAAAISAAPAPKLPLAPGPAAEPGRFSLDRANLRGVLYFPPEALLNVVPANPIQQQPDLQAPGLGGRVPGTR